VSSHSSPPSPIAYSYIRFSHPDQAKGDSLRRQTVATAEWCERNNVLLDASLTLHDLGKSAYTGEHRKNPDRHALASFLQLIERGKVPKGSYLIVENLDRLSREEEVPACHLLTSILMAGVRVVQLKPVELTLTEKSPGWDIMRAVMELSRGHGESAIKSERVGGAWQEKKRRARNGEPQKATNRMGEGCKVITHRLPAWVEERGGKLHLIPERQKAVKRIFELAIAGYGHVHIIKKLAEENTQPFGRSPWSRSYISRILNDRRALGEFQPCKRDGKPDGDPIKNYFPSVVTEAEWFEARAGQEQRYRHRGRVSQHINVFSGLLFKAGDSDPYYCRTAPTGGNGSARRLQRVLVRRSCIEGRGSMDSFPFPSFEKAILSRLREIDPRDILKDANGHDEIMELEGELGQIESAIAAIVSDLDAHGESPTLFARLRAKETRKNELNKRLAEARQKAANPLSAGWAEMKSLLEAIEEATDPDDARMRLRTILRRIVEGIWLLVVPTGRDRLALVQIWFKGNRRFRSYIILHRRAVANKYARTDGRVWCESWGTAEGQGLLNPNDPTPDLRSPEYAVKLEKQFAKSMREAQKHKDVWKWFYENKVKSVDMKSEVTRGPSGDTQVQLGFIIKSDDESKS
jgi:DNA invertase Pin-like site-specific DNA recombinase